MTNFEKQLEQEANENKVCEYGLCDGSGIREQGDADDIIETKCLCAKEQIV